LINYACLRQSSSASWLAKQLTPSSRDAFREQLSIIESGVVTADDILNAATPQTPLDWLSLVLLLDQVPRNCYRGPVAKTAFTVFDPIALAITLRAIENGIPEIPPIRYYAGYRLWFYLPLQHSEEPKIHELSMRENARIFTDIKALVDGPDTIAEGNNSMKYCRNFLSENRDGIERWETMLLSFASRHKVIIDRFGRYPHRNEAMGRKSTEEELKYLAEGGETFTSG